MVHSSWQRDTFPGIEGISGIASAPHPSLEHTLATSELDRLNRSSLNVCKTCHPWLDARCRWRWEGLEVREVSREY